MCGIVGYVGKKNAIKVIISGLETLEYRGYDSAGIAYRNVNNELKIIKETGKIVNLKEKLDFGSAAGKMIAQFLCVLSEFERETISERVKEGVKSARERGRFGGRPATPEKTLNKEKELVGIYLSAHPLDEFKIILDYVCNTRMIEFNNKEALLDREILAGGIVSGSFS